MKDTKGRDIGGCKKKKYSSTFRSQRKMLDKMVCEVMKKAQKRTLMGGTDGKFLQVFLLVLCLLLL